MLASSTCPSKNDPEKGYEMLLQVAYDLVLRYTYTTNQGRWTSSVIIEKSHLNIMRQSLLARFGNSTLEIFHAHHEGLEKHNEPESLLFSTNRVIQQRENFLLRYTTPFQIPPHLSASKHILRPRSSQSVPAVILASK